MKRFMTGLLASLWMMSMTAMAGNAVEFPVRCEAPGADETFICELMKDGEVVQTLELKDGWSGAFTVTAEDAGTTEYTIRQRRGGNGDIIYDERTYTAVIYADFAYSDVADGELEAEPVIYLDRDGGKLAECSFVNSMKPVVPSEPDSMVQWYHRKGVKGHEGTKDAAQGASGHPGDGKRSTRAADGPEHRRGMPCAGRRVPGGDRAYDTVRAYRWNPGQRARTACHGDVVRREEARAVLHRERGR